MLTIAAGILLAVGLLAVAESLLVGLAMMAVIGSGAIAALLIFIALPPPGRVAMLLTIGALIVLSWGSRARYQRQLEAEAQARDRAVQEAVAWREIRERKDQLEKWWIEHDGCRFRP